ncbi:hypothetical protein [Corynebacterium nasicanis]|uniref:Cell wall hydrolase interfering with FtsZ ring assembly n=1 Tax=Corynebacterium nasicanis TaxID=1448267 RepID=A0ABW1Q7J5_9CORY
MTIFLNDSRPGGRALDGDVLRVPTAAVWEPSGFVEGTARERGVRTLRPLDRTQQRAVAPHSSSAQVTWRERGVRRRDTWTTYLVGALFGSALIGAAILGDTGDGGQWTEHTPPAAVGQAR